MNSFDVVILVILVIFTLLGMWRGLLREIITILTWVLSFALAWLFAARFAYLFASISNEPVLQQVVSFVAIFFVVFTAGTAASWLIHKYIPPKSLFRAANVVFGGLFGAARGAVIIISIFLVAGLTSFPQRPWWRESAITPYFERAALYVSGYLPSDIARHIHYG
jgi:membrane protein required for colicin V production